MEFTSYRDTWGIPHLRARTARALAFAQGRNAAADRSSQITAARHRAEGTAAARFGPGALGWDRFARQARIDDTARRCFPHSTRTAPDRRLCRRRQRRARRRPGAPVDAVGGLAVEHLVRRRVPAKLWRGARRHLGRRSRCSPPTVRTAGQQRLVADRERTASGASLLAGDPHSFIEAPESPADMLPAMSSTWRAWPYRAFRPTSTYR